MGKIRRLKEVWFLCQVSLRLCKHQKLKNIRIVWSRNYHCMVKSLKLNILNLCEDMIDTKIASLVRQFVVIPFQYSSVAAPNAVSHHAIDFVRNFITPQIRFASLTAHVQCSTSLLWWTVQCWELELIADVIASFNNGFKGAFLESFKKHKNCKDDKHTEFSVVSDTKITG